MPRRVPRKRQRAEPKSLWVNAPLQNAIRDELDRREWTPADLGRAIGSQPSLISRWMQGQRPDTDSIALIADALGMDDRHLLILAGHLRPRPEDEMDADPRIKTLCAKIWQVDLTEARHQVLDVLLETFRQHPVEGDNGLERTG